MDIDVWLLKIRKRIGDCSRYQKIPGKAKLLSLLLQHLSVVSFSKHIPSGPVSGILHQLHCLDRNIKRFLISQPPHRQDSDSVIMIPKPFSLSGKSPYPFLINDIVKYLRLFRILRINLQEMFPHLIRHREDPIHLLIAFPVHLPCISTAFIINMHKCRLFLCLYMICHIIGWSTFQIGNRQIIGLIKAFTSIRKNPPQDLVRLDLFYLSHIPEDSFGISDLACQMSVSYKRPADSPHHFMFPLFGQHWVLTKRRIQKSHPIRKPLSQLPLPHQDIKGNLIFPLSFQCIQELKQRCFCASTPQCIDHK